MIEYLTATKGLNRDQAYMLCSLAGDLKIAETVDVPHMLVTMQHAKAHLRETLTGALSLARAMRPLIPDVRFACFRPTRHGAS